jgi:hypothetical protein
MTEMTEEHEIKVQGKLATEGGKYVGRLKSSDEPDSPKPSATEPRTVD